MPYRLICGDVREKLRELPDGAVQCVVTSPPYWGAQRDYEMPGQLGHERTPEEFCGTLVEVFRDMRRVLRQDGTLWLNLGDSYAASGKGGGGKLMKTRGEAWGHRDRMRGWRSPPAGYKQKDLVGVPWLVAFALRADGWYLRRDIVWDKRRATEPTRADRPSTAHELVFLMAQSRRYFYRPTEAPQSSVWGIPSDGSAGGHVASFPEELPRRCIAASTRQGDVVLDPFCGSGTAPMMALRMGRVGWGIDLNPRYVELARQRINGDAPLLNRGEVA